MIPGARNPKTKINKQQTYRVMNNAISILAGVLKNQKETTESESEQRKSRISSSRVAVKILHILYYFLLRIFFHQKFIY